MPGPRRSQLNLVTSSRRFRGGLIALVGFLLSPLSWWNDLFVNVPLALAFAWVVSWPFPRIFGASFVVGYWLTNLVGLWLLHLGTRQLASPDSRPKPGQLRRSLLVSVLYTVVLVALLEYQVLQPLPDYGLAR